MYEVFLLEEVFRLARCLELHFTPKHGSWFNIAEVELAALANQCLGDRRISGIGELNEEMFAWHSQSNLSQRGVDWQFTTNDARIKLKHLIQSYYKLLDFTE